MKTEEVAKSNIIHQQHAQSITIIAYNSFPCVLSIQTALIRPIHSNAYDNFTEFSCSKSMNPNSNLNITE